MPTKEREPFEFYDKWRADALCAQPANRVEFFENHDVWFPDEDTDEDTVRRDTTKALSLCFDCPVRDLCLRESLETQTIHGTRGGLTEEQTRKTLSVDEDGKEVRRGAFPDCPYCGAPTGSLRPTTIDLPDGGRWAVAKAVRCEGCGFEWKSRSSHNAVVAYGNEQKKKAEQARREQIARERLSN